MAKIRELERIVESVKEKSGKPLTDQKKTSISKFLDSFAVSIWGNIIGRNLRPDSKKVR